MMRRVKLCLLLSVLAPAAVNAQQVNNGMITIGRVDSIASTTLKEYRKLWVYTPPSYRDTTYLPQRYPVLYLLDGDAHFHSVTGLVHILGTGVNGTYVFPEMIVVAIPNTNRTRDLTPSNSDKDPNGKTNNFFKASGGNPNFFRFLQEELIPKIDADYRTTSYRILVGHSFGGITAINALYQIPTVFNAYVAIDPSIWWDNQLLLRQLRDHISKPGGLAGRTLYVAHANTLVPTDTTVNRHFNAITQFNRTLDIYNRSGLRYSYKYYNEDDHGSVPLIRPSIAEFMQRPASVTEHFANVSAALGYTVKPPEPMLDLLANYTFNFFNDTTKALEFYRTYAELYPNSARPYKALGQALSKRDPKRALENYEKALALKPQDETVKEAIRKLKAGN
jgi:predicted alpha/beta superfamily hydrolase